jgi:hypothetical protein
MDKNKLLKKLYLLLHIAFWTAVITGLIKFPGLVSSFGTNVKNLPFIEISFIHRWSGVLAALLLFATIILKKKIVKKKK